MGYFGCAYGLFLPIYALSITGLSTAVASLVAKEHGAGHIQNVRKIRRTARLLFAGVGLLLSGFIWLFAVPFARSTAADASAAYAIRMMAPAAFFGCLAAVERGYYEGLCNMYPTAISQAVESIAKVVCGLLFSHYVFTHETQVLAYFPAGTPILPIAAAAAVLVSHFPLPAVFCISFSAIWAAMGCQRLYLPPLRSRLVRSCGRCFKSCCRLHWGHSSPI